MTVDNLKRLLDIRKNYWNGNECIQIAGAWSFCIGTSMVVAGNLTDQRFSINWKRQRVDIWMS